MRPRKLKLTSDVVFDRNGNVCAGLYSTIVLQPPVFHQGEFFSGRNYTFSHFVSGAFDVDLNCSSEYFSFLPLSSLGRGPTSLS